jgi:hypothetical protein
MKHGVLAGFSDIRTRRLLDSNWPFHEVTNHLEKSLELQCHVKLAPLVFRSHSMRVDNFVCIQTDSRYPFLSGILSVLGKRTLTLFE